jgi:hypothetical protein
MWVGGGGRSEAVTNANGDALLEGAGAAGGTLTISARDYQPLEGGFDQTPGTLQEVALVPSPGSMLRVRVVSGADEALAWAVVQLIPRSAGDVAEFSTAGANGVATFVDVPPGPLQFSAHADGYGVATVGVAEDGRGSIVIALTRSQ